jgi:hypothetical protein
MARPTRRAVPWRGLSALLGGCAVGPLLLALYNAVLFGAPTLQYSPDGVRFHRVRDAEPPKSPGPYRADAFADAPGPNITWGLCQRRERPGPPYLLRFDCDLRAP